MSMPWPIGSSFGVESGKLSRSTLAIRVESRVASRSVGETL
jgi:hypothetical protein